MTVPVFRFAPSSNGELHLGHAFSALVNFAAAREAGGRFLLRIEDIDTTRCTPAFRDAIMRDLAWLGLEWEEPVRRQSDHMADYIGHWLKVMKGDSRAIFTAAAKASEATRYLKAFSAKEAAHAA